MLAVKSLKVLKVVVFLAVKSLKVLKVTVVFLAVVCHTLKY